MTFPILIIFFLIKDDLVNIDNKTKNTSLDPVNLNKKRNGYIGLSLTFLTNF